jgi:hypothetical protein
MPKRPHLWKLWGPVLAVPVSPLHAQPALPSPPQSAPGNAAGAEAAGQNADEDEVVVTGQRPRGSVIGDIPPENVLRGRDVRSTGATNFDELLQAIAPEIGSAGGGSTPLVLLNGRKVSSFRELRDIPIEAISRVDILPAEVALKYGSRPDQKVVNIVLKARFQSTVGEVAGDTSKGGYSGGYGDVTRMRIDGNARSTLNLHAGGDDLLNAAQRQLAQEQSVASPGLPSEFRLRGGGTVTRDLPGGLEETGNLEAEHDVGRTLGDVSGQLPSKFNRDTTTDSLHAGSALNWDVAKWHWNVIGNADYQLQKSTAENGVSTFASDSARSARAAADLTATANGPLFQLPAGPVGMTVRVGAAGEELDVDGRHIGIWSSDSTGRTSASGALNLDLPVSHRGHKPDFLGNLTLNGNAEVDQLSDFGTLTALGAGANWSPVNRANLIVSWRREAAAPSVRQLGDAILDTPGTRIFDFTNGAMTRTEVVTGGNRDLRVEHRNVFKAGGTWKLLPNSDLKLRADYAHVAIDRPISAITVSPQIEEIFPDRFVRDSAGELLVADLRPTNFASARRDTLQLGFDFTKALRSRRPTASMINQAVARAREAGINLPETGAPATTEAAPDSLANAALNHGRLQFSLTDTITLVDRAVIVRGAPALDYLHGAAIGETGGEPRHDVQAQAGWFNNGVGARLGFNWRSATIVDTAAGGPLHFSSLATFDIKLFANVGQDLALVGKHPWLLGSSIRFEIGNLFDARPDVRDFSGGRVPGFEPGQLDPLGRTIMISFRKQFLPASYYRSQLQNLQQRAQQPPQ